MSEKARKNPGNPRMVPLSDVPFNGSPAYPRDAVLRRNPGTFVPEGSQVGVSWSTGKVYEVVPDRGLAGHGDLDVP
jgi:hypothetical protein